MPVFAPILRVLFRPTPRIRFGLDGWASFMLMKTCSAPSRTNRYRLLNFVLLSASLAFVAGCASTPLTLNQAIQFNDSAKTGQLIAAGQGINEKDLEGNTPLHHAAQNGRRDLLASLIAAGATVNSQNNAGETPLLKFLRTGEFHPASVASFLDRNADPNLAAKDGFTPMSFAASSACTSYDFSAKLSVLRALIERGGDMNRADSSGRTALHFAATARPTKALELVASRVANLNATVGPEGFNAYTFAVLHGQRDNARFLAAKGLKPQLVASPDIIPRKSPRDPLEVNQGSMITALAHDWYGVWLLEKSPSDIATARQMFAVAREQYDLAAAEYSRARLLCEAEIPKAQVELAAQRTNAIFSRVLGTALGLAAGIGTGTGIVVYPVAPGFTSKLDFLNWHLGQLDRDLTQIKARSTTLQNPELVNARELWGGKPASAARGKWSDKICLITRPTVTVRNSGLFARVDRDAEIRILIDEFAAQLKQAGVFADANPEEEPAPGRRITMTLTFVEKFDMHDGSELANRFSFGVAGDSFSRPYTYHSAVTAQLGNAGEPAFPFSARAEHTVKYPKNSIDAIPAALKQARTESTRKALAELVVQMSQ